MMTSLTPEYLTGLEAVLPRATMRSKGSADVSIGARALLPRSRETGRALATALSEAQTPEERSLVEVQLLAAAAADLAVAERLAGAPEESQSLRGDAPDDALIWQGLTNPASLLRPTIHPPRYRGADKDLQAAIYQTLTSIQEDVIETTADAITAALTMNIAILREAAKLAGLDVKQALEDLGADEVVTFVIEAWQKLADLIGEDNFDKIENTLSESIEKLREKTAIATYVKKFLSVDGIYKDCRTLVQHYDGPDQDLARLTPEILALEGSFAGRNKLAATLIRLLSLAKLAKVLRTPPWGPMIVASGYLLIIGYELYSAHDHVDSDRFPFFDRVAGVQTLITTGLGGD